MGKESLVRRGLEIDVVAVRRACEMKGVAMANASSTLTSYELEGCSVLCILCTVCTAGHSAPQ